MKLSETLSGHFGRVWCLDWSPDGNVLASCGEDKTIRLWAYERRPEGSAALNLKITLTDGHARTIRSVCWSPCGTQLASASFDSTVTVWSKKDDDDDGKFECDVTLEGHENEVKAVAWSKSGQFLATCSRDKSVWIWQVSRTNEFDCAAVINAHSQDVKKVVWHPKLDVFASASYDNTIKIFSADRDNDDHDDEDEDEWTCVDTLYSHQSTVWSIAFDASGQRLASCSDDRTVKIWRQFEADNVYGVTVTNGRFVWKCVCTLSGYHGRSVYDVSWCHLTELIATACADDNIRIFKETSCSNAIEPTFQLLICFNAAHSQDVNCVRWNPSRAGTLASCSDDGFVKVWQIEEKYF